MAERCLWGLVPNWGGSGSRLCPKQLVIDQMLGDDLQRRRQLDFSKSSFLGEQADERRLKEMIEERDKTIRLLTKKIDRLEATSRRTAGARSVAEEVKRGKEENHCFELLKAEVGKTQRLEEIIQTMTKRINQLLEELAQENTFTDDSEDLRLMLDQLDFQNSLSVSLDIDQQSLHSTLAISQDWTRVLDILEVAFRACKQRTQACQRETATLTEKFAQPKERRDSEEVLQLRAEVREGRKEREKLRGLLDKTEIEKNELINRISTISLRDPEVKDKSKEELVQYSKELNYRIQDLEKEKEDILKSSTKHQQVELKKYQDVLRQLRNIKEASRIGKCCA